MIEHLLVVAAPSGAGKTTFVNQLISRGSAADITAHLPAGAEHWMRVKHGQHKQWLPTVTTAPEDLSGVILEYDLTSRRAAVSYQTDPALRLLRMARRITVVNLKAPAEQLITQIAYRETGARTKQSVSQRRLGWGLAYWVRSTLFAVLRRLSGALPRSAIDWFKQLPSIVQLWSALKRKGLFVKIKRYEKSGWLEDVYLRWQVYLDAEAKAGARIEQVFLAPEALEKADQVYRWRIADAAPIPESCSNNSR